MLNKAREETILLCGRDFTPEELDDVIDTVRMFPKLSLHGLITRQRLF